MAIVVVQVEGNPDGAELEAAVDADIAAFDAHFQEQLKNEPLAPAEKAILKTYLHYKTHQPTGV